MTNLRQSQVAKTTFLTIYLSFAAISGYTLQFNL